MWPFSKVKKIEQLKPTHKLAYRETKVSLGCTDVVVTFDDGTEFTVRRYGYVDQYITSSPAGPHVSPFGIVSSLAVAQNMLVNLTNHGSTFVDDENNIRLCKIGKPVNAYIDKTFEYETTYNEAYLEEIKDGS